MTHQKLFFPLLTACVLLAVGCSQSSEPSSAPSTTPPAATAPAAPNASAYDTIASGRGFTVGAMMSAQPVYVLFEPQCPHCAALWQASTSLQDRVKFVWIPVAFNSGKSLAQAATLLSASDPVTTMNSHEASVLAGSGGIATPEAISPEMKSVIEANTQLLSTLGQNAVPFIVAKQRQSGAVISHSGALNSADLAKFLGLD